MRTVRVARLTIGSILRLAQVPLAAALAALAAAPAVASAQTKAVQPYHVVTIRDTEIRCGDSDALYAVANVKAGQLLRVDGEVAGFYRVEYLPGMVAFMKAEEGAVDAGGKAVSLKDPNKLLAASVLRREGAHYWPLLDSALPAGTSLPLVETLKSADGKVYGYLVSAPAGSRGFVRQLAVRKATPAESAAAAPSRPATTPATTPSTSPTTPPTTPATLPATTPATTPGGPAAGGQTPASGVQPGSQPGGPATTPQTQPTVPGVQPGTQPGAPAVTPTPAPPVELQPVGDLERLAELFDGVMAPGKSGEEIDAVIAEFNRSIRASGDPSVKAGLERRLEALTLKKEVLVAANRLRTAGNDDSAQEVRVREAVANAQRQAVYTIVGRILPSTVYDGNRGMPLMFRVEAADSASTRTIGYIVPRAGVDLLSKSGKVVGIVGESRFDEALRLNIVAARRVDVLNPSGAFEPDRSGPSTSAPAPAVATPAEPAPAEPAEDPSDSVTIEEIDVNK